MRRTALPSTVTLFYEFAKVIGGTSTERTARLRSVTLLY